MKKTVSILLSLLLAVVLSAQSTDSSKFAALGLKLAEYYDAMKGESLAVQEAECDFLIESASDVALRQFIAQDIYEHYMNSPMMGSENIAVHVFDKWFSDGTLAMSSPEKSADARTYAEFNRQSLIGERAPVLELEGFDGAQVSLFGTENPMKKFSVLYFYDTDCTKCKLETYRLNSLFADRNYPIQLYAIYVGDNQEAWKNYITGQFGNISSSVISAKPSFSIIHLWDPTLSSDFQRKYGVTTAPRLFLIGPDCIILGRGLDTEALSVMLEGIFAKQVLTYGTPESEALFDGIFSMSSGQPSVGEVSGIADYIRDRTLASGDTLMFRQMAGDYLYYLSSRVGEGFKEGMRYHIDSNVLSQDNVWTSSDDTLKVVGFARIMSDLLSKAAPGTHMPSVKVPGELYTFRRNIGGKTDKGAIVRQDILRKLDKLKGDENIIIFYTEGCEVCAAEKSAALAMLKSDEISVFMVNMDDLMTSDPALASRLMDSFDLSSLPYIIMTDRHGKILRRYFSLQ